MTLSCLLVLATILGAGCLPRAAEAASPLFFGDRS